MRKFTILLALLAFLGVQAVQAQKTIEGTVTSAEDGSPIPGVQVVVKGTTQGTTTDLDGNYEITVNDEAKTLVFKFVGMVTKEISIGDKTVINVTMEPEVKDIEGVVVTAIGVRRETKKLGYSVSNIESEEITKTQTNDALSALQGKVAGVDITSSSGQPTASNNVIIRGYSSVTGNNQPLYVVDGTPINNSINESADNLNNQLDFGNGASSIDPSNIKSMNILKGAAATALYGSRAANGVVMITTKSGSKNQDMKVEFSSSSTFTEPLRITQQQNVYGQGWSGDWASSENGSWGPRMDGEMRLWGNVVDNSQLLKPFEAQEDNLEDFFDIGESYKNSISMRGGGENTTFFASYGNTNSDGFIPTDADSYDRHAINLKGSTSTDNFTFTGNINYIRREASAVAAGQGGDAATLMQDIMQIPRDFSIVDMADYNNKFYNVDNFYTPYAQNPYFIINENGNEMKEDRVYGNLNVDYSLTDNININWRIGQDIRNVNTQIWNAKAVPSEDSPNSSQQPVPGNNIERSTHRKQINSDLTINYNKSYDSFDLNLLGGWNVNERYYKMKTAEVTTLDMPDYYNLANSNDPPQADTDEQRRRLYGIYGQAELGYNDYLFMTLTARNDWSSTLPEDNRSFFYPGVTLGFILSDAIPEIQNFADYFKLRAAWGKTGNDAPPYAVKSVMVPAEADFPFGSIDFPIGGVTGYEVSDQIGNNNLQPEITSEFELGANIKFFENRLGVDFAYYNRTTTDQIFSVPLAASSGYGSQYMNFGEVSNEGIELGVNITPVETDDFAWNMDYTFTQNRNEVVELPEGQEQVIINGAYEMDYVAMEGEPLGVFKGPVAKRDPDGNIIVDNTGIPKVADDKEIYGNQERDFTMGLDNTFSYKNFDLSAAVDWRKGGMMYSYTARINYFVGNATKTLYNHREPFVVPNSVQEVDTDGDGESEKYVENTTQIDRPDVFTYWNQTDNKMMSQEHVVDKSFFKLRDVTLSYSIPQDALKNVPFSKVELGVYGRNLIIWTPEENNFVDPEMTTFGNDAYSSMGEWGGVPTARTYGINLNLSF